MAAAIGMTACRHRKKRKMTHRKVKRGGPAGRQAGTIRRGENTWNLEDSQAGRRAGRKAGRLVDREAGHRDVGKEKKKMTHRKVKRGGPAGRQAGTIRRGENMWNLEDSQVGRQAGRPEGWSAGRQAIGMTACRQRKKDR